MKVLLSVLGAVFLSLIRLFSALQLVLFLHFEIVSNCVFES